MASVFTIDGVSPEVLSMLGTPTDVSFWNTDQGGVQAQQAIQQALPPQMSHSNQGATYFNMDDTGPLRNALANRVQLGVPASEYGVTAVSASEYGVTAASPAALQAKHRRNPRNFGNAEQPVNVPANPNVVYYPINYGGPYAPHGTVIGPARPPTYVYGPGGTPTVYTYQPPDRGPIDVYANEQTNLVTLGGASLGHYDSYEERPSGHNWLAVGVGIALGAAAVWLMQSSDD